MRAEQNVRAFLRDKNPTIEYRTISRDYIFQGLTTEALGILIPLRVESRGSRGREHVPETRPRGGMRQSRATRGGVSVGTPR